MNERIEQYQRSASGGTGAGDPLRRLAEKITDRLFLDGSGERAQRLVLTIDGPPYRRLGGWGQNAVADVVEKELRHALVSLVSSPHGWPIEVVRQRASDFSEGYRAGYADGLDGNAEDSETAWCKSKASGELAILPLEVGETPEEKP